MRTWNINKKAIKMIHSIYPGYLSALILTNVVNVITPFFEIYMSSKIITQLSENISREVYVTIVITVLGIWLFSGLQDIVQKWFSQKNFEFIEEERRTIANRYTIWICSWSIIGQVM